MGGLPPRSRSALLALFALLVPAVVCVPLTGDAQVPPALPPECALEGGELRCTWERAFLAREGVTPYLVERRDYEHAFTLPFPARIEVTLHWDVPQFFALELFEAGQQYNLSGSNDGVLHSETTSGQDLAFNHSLLRPAELGLRVVDKAIVANAYRLEVHAVPDRAPPAPADEHFRGVIGRSVDDPWNPWQPVVLPVRGPGVGMLELRLESGPPTAHVEVADALGHTLGMSFLRGDPLRLRFLASGDEAFGTWSFSVTLQVGTGYGPPPVPVGYEAHYTFAPTTGFEGIPAPSVPNRPLLADALGDAADARLDVLGAWFSDETDDRLVANVLLAEVADPPTAPSGHDWDIVLRWNYTDAAVELHAVSDAPCGYYGGAAPRLYYDARVTRRGESPLSDAILAGRAIPGKPGVLSFLAPKAFIASPAAGHAFSDVAVETSFRPCQVADPKGYLASGGGGIADRASSPASYVVGSHEAPTAVAPTRGIPAPSAAPLMAAGGVLAVVVVAVAAAAQVRRRSRVPASAYERVRLLGRGASGATYLARHRRLGRLVAVKELSPALAHDLDARERLVREARIAGGLRHPSIVEILDVAEGPGGLALVMEHVPGGSLQQRLDREGTLPLEEALRMWSDLLSALAAVHATGVVHRDVKPSNILLTAEGRMKLADFGIAHAVGEQTLLGLGAGRGSSGAIGTPRYMAPEQLRGFPPSAASDVYAATAVACRMLTGSPHLPDEKEIAVASVPPSVTRLLERGLDPRAERRPSAASLRRALEERLRRDQHAPHATRP